MVLSSFMIIPEQENLSKLFLGRLLKRLMEEILNFCKISHILKMNQ